MQIKLESLTYTVTHDLFADAMERIDRKIEHDGEMALELALAEHGFVREKTCNNVSRFKRAGTNFICSACGLGEDWGCMENEGMGMNFYWKYCPNCGAKVVDDNAD